MANIRLIRRRIKSAQNISQITRAMEMVAASKMKRAQQAAVMGKPYAEKIYEMVRQLAKVIDKKFHPLLSFGNPDGKLLVILISTNKGLCGGLNANLLRSVALEFTDEVEVDFISLGKKGQQYVVKRGGNLIADFSEKTPFTEYVTPATKLIVDGFTNRTYKEVYLFYNTFMTVLNQRPTKKKILPIISFEEVEKKETDKIVDMLIEPSVSEVLSRLLPHYLENQVRSAILEAEASEHSARMIAMKNATEEALEFMEELTLIYNKERQEKITYEIADMVTARIAVE